MDFSPICGVFREYNDDEMAALRESIKLHGQKLPIITFNNLIWDGKHRYRACLAEGVEPLCEEWRGSESDLIAEVWDRNYVRRHQSKAELLLSISKWSKLLGTAEPCTCQPERGRGRPETTSGRVRKKVAALVGVSLRQVQQAEKVINGAVPQVVTLLADGKLNVGLADKVASLPKEGQALVAERIGSGAKPAKAYKDVANGKLNQEGAYIDKLGKPVPEQLRFVFADHVITETITMLEKCLSNVTAIKSWAVWTWRFATADCIEEAIDGLRSGIPYAVHQSCHGRGCKDCRNGGYVSQDQYEDMVDRNAW